MSTINSSGVSVHVLCLAALTCACLSPSAGAEPPAALELLDKYTDALNAVRSFIAKKESVKKLDYAFDRNFPDRMMAGLRRRGQRQYSRGQTRTDGKRFHTRSYSWGNLGPTHGDVEETQAHYNCDNWDGVTLYGHAGNVKVPGTVTLSKPTASQVEHPMSRRPPASYLVGYNMESDERMDSILRKAKNISVSSRMENVGGSDCYVLRADTDKGTLSLWIDPAHGYNLAKAEARLSEGDFSYSYRLKRGESRVTRLENVRFERVDGVWVPMEADVSQHRKYRAGTVNEDYHYKRTDFVLNPDHEALGSFDNPIENPKNDPELKNGTDVYRLGDPDTYIWQDGKVVDKDGKVIMDSQPKQESDSKESQSETLGKKPGGPVEVTGLVKHQQGQAVSDVRMVVSPRFAPKSAQEANPGQVRVVHFPKDRSLGKLYIRDAEAVRELTYWFHWTGTGQRSEYLCEAQGDVNVPAGTRLTLTVNRTGWRDLSPLAKLQPDDLYELGITVLLTDPVKPSDECMPYIAHLTGLKSLRMDRTNVTDRGFGYIRNLKSLEYLHMPLRVTDRGMAYVAQLRSLKGLYFGQMGSQVTDTGLRHLAKLNSLQELALWGERMGDYGLAHLRGLPRLEYLFLYGTHFTDKGCVHLKEIPSLKILSFYEGRCRITDAGLADVSKIATLESLSLNATGPITNDGIAHLSKMRSLRKLDIANSQITDIGLRYLSQIRTLETLNLPQEQKGITDKGLAYLGQLPNLKHLSISRFHFNDPKMNREYYTDKGLAELAKCRSLENLSVGSIGITDAGLSDIAKLTNLTDLNLFGCDNVTDTGVAKLTALKALRNLYIRHSDVSITALNHLKPMPNLTKLNVYPIKRDGAILDISGLTALEDLNLSFGSYSEKFVDADLKCLAGLKNLRSLQIGPRDYTDQGMAYLAGLTNMERLGMGGSGLTNEGLQYLADMKKLNFLSILSGFDKNKRDFGSGGNITDKGLRYLEGLQALSFLEIYSDNSFSDTALRRLQRELPNLFTLRINGGILLRVNGKDSPRHSNTTEQKAPTIRQSRRSAPVRRSRGSHR